MMLLLMASGHRQEIAVFSTDFVKVCCQAPASQAAEEDEK